MLATERNIDRSLISHIEAGKQQDPALGTSAAPVRPEMGQPVPSLRLGTMPTGAPGNRPWCAAACWGWTGTTCASRWTGSTKYHTDVGNIKGYLLASLCNALATTENS